jgi:hypothetical protein
MTRVTRVISGSWLFCLLLVTPLARCGAAAPPPEELLPASTTGFVAISNLQKLQHSWMQTQLFKLLNDSAFKPFVDDTIPKTKGGNYLLDTIGVSWDTVRNAAGGELGWGVVLANPREAAHVLTLDMTGRQAQGESFFREIGKKLQEQGGRLEGPRKLDGFSMIVAEMPNNKPIIYGIKDNIMICTDHFGTLQGILARMNGSANNTLAGQLPYQVVRRRCRPQPDETPYIRWYFVPVTRAEVQLILQPELRKVRGDNLVQVLRKEGVDAIQGVGGTIAMACNGTDMLLRGSSYAPQPFKNAMRMAKLPNETHPAPEPWVPADVSAWATVSLDLVNAFDGFETVFERLADEDPGTFKDIMNSLKTDPNGPMVDVRKEIFEQLSNRITFINDAVLPITVKSERFLVGVPVKDDAAVKILTDALRKCFEPDKRFTARKFQDAVIWEYRPRPPKAKPGKQPPVQMPTISLVVAKKVLFISTHVDFLEKVLTQGEQPGLAVSPEYQNFMREMVRLGMGPSSSRFFGRLEEGARTTYEMMRAGQLAKVESVYAQILLQLVKMDEEGKRLRVDVSKLPPYERITPYLDLIGSYSTTFDDGWSVVAVAVKR